MKVHWTETAIKHLKGIQFYIAQNSSTYAKRIIDRLTKRSQQIGEFPTSGRIVPEVNSDRIREVIEGPYRIIYYIKSNQIDILAVIHGAENFPWGQKF